VVIVSSRSVRPQIDRGFVYASAAENCGLMDRDTIIERLTKGRAGTGRGDHDLNPDLRPEGSLVPAAVLVPLVPRDAGMTVLLTQRTDHLHDHAGQISFPGGRIEGTDPSAEDAAIRETVEEVGVEQTRIELIGQLDPYVTRTGYAVTPVVGFVLPPFSVRPDPFEVADVFEVPLGFILDPANLQRHSRLFEGKQRHFYALPYRERYIWGATAGMLVNLAQVLNER